MKRKPPEDLLPTLRLVLEGFEMVGLPALKSRDRREPGRKEKMEYEDRLRSIIVRHFGRQRRIIRERLEREYPERKALDDFDAIYDDEDLITELMRLFRDATKHGIALFGQMSKLQIDWSLTNTRAFEWAKEYTYELVRLIDNTTRDILRSSISQFVDTPGMTIRDVMDTLPFDEERAQRVAVTEITRAYATANQLAGEDLKKEFPGVPVIKIWTTNNDDKVCTICGPLDGKEVDIDEDFTTNISQPPAHVNCRCWMNTTTALADLGEGEGDGGYAGEIVADKRISGTARANPDGSISINPDKYNELSDRGKESVIAHEVSHQTVEEYILHNQQSWNEAEEMLNMGDEWYLGGHRQIGESIADTSAAYLIGDTFGNLSKEKWEIISDWIAKKIRSAGYTPDGLRRSISRMMSEAEDLLK